MKHIKRPSQLERLRTFFLQRKSRDISLREIFRFCYNNGITNITGRISDLRKSGMVITNSHVHSNGIIKSWYKVW